MLLTEAFPIIVTSPAKLRPTSTESPDTISPTVNEERGFPPMQYAKRRAKRVWGKGVVTCVHVLVTVHRSWQCRISYVQLIYICFI